MLTRHEHSRASALLALSAACLIALVLAGCGGAAGDAEEAREVTIDDVWSKAQEAEKELASWHMEIASYYENTAYGGGPIQSIIIEVEGDDLHEKDLMLGQVYSEYIRAGGKQYSRDMASGAWEEVPVEGEDDDPGERFPSQVMELPSLADSQEYMGTESIDSRDAERFRFTLSPAAVREMFAAQPTFDFSQNRGGVVDVWIDARDYYMSRYELVIKNVGIPEQIGIGDIRFVVNIRDVNEDMDIEPPS